jgi:transcriptional regulator with XRE-family HTH domain
MTSPDGGQGNASPTSMAEALRKLRKRGGLSQAELAAAADLSASYVSLIEAGRRVPRGDNLDRLARVLRVSRQELLGGEAADPQIIEMELRHAEASLAAGHAARALRDLALIERRYGGTIGADLGYRIRIATGAALFQTGRTDRGLADLELALAESASAGELILALKTLSACYLEAGDIARAIDLAERGLDQGREIAATLSTEFVALAATLAAAYRERGDMLSAEVVCQQALDFAERNGSPQGRALALRSASLGAQARGDWQHAQAMARSALGAFAEDDSRLQLARMRLTYARILLSIDPQNSAQAESLITEAAPVISEASSAAEAAQCQLDLASSALAAGQPERALEIALPLTAGEDEATTPESVRALLIVARVHLLTGQRARARATMRAAGKRLLAAAPRSRSAAHAWRDLGDLYAAAHSPREAVTAYAGALTLLGIQPQEPWGSTSRAAAAH